MHDVERIAVIVKDLVRSMKPFEHACNDGCDDAVGGTLAQFFCRLQQTGDRVASHELHDDEKLVVGRDRVEDRDHIRMIDAGRQVGFIQEHRHEVRIQCAMRMHALDGNRTRQSLVDFPATMVDGCHAPGSHLALEDIVTNVYRKLERKAHDDTSYKDKVFRARYCAL